MKFTDDEVEMERLLAILKQVCGEAMAGDVLDATVRETM